MFGYIKKVTYKKQPAFIPEEYFCLENDENGYVITYSNNNNIKSNKIENNKKEDVMQYFDKLFRIIDRWKEKYENDANIIDGTQWQLQIEYINGEIRDYIGNNEFPYNFEYLNKINNELINKGGE